jgi:hypothetical protein
MIKLWLVGISFLPLNPLSMELEWCSLAPAASPPSHHAATGVMVRKTGSYGVIVNALLELLRELYPESAIMSPNVLTASSIDVRTSRGDNPALRY